MEQVSSFRKLVDQFDMQEFQHYNGSMLTTKAPGVLTSKQNEIVFSRHINIHCSVMNDNRKI